MNIDLDSWEAGYADGLCTRVVSLRGWFRPGVVFERLLPGPRMACRVAHEDATVNAGAKMHRLAGAKIHQRCWQEAPELGAFRHSLSDSITS